MCCLSVPAPRHLTLERQLNKSILISWSPPEAYHNQIEMYHVYVDGFLRTTVKASDKTKALVEGVDSHRVSKKFSKCSQDVANQKWRENRYRQSIAGSGHKISCLYDSLNFLWGILAMFTMLHISDNSIFLMQWVMAMTPNREEVLPGRNSNILRIRTSFLAGSPSLQQENWSCFSNCYYFY